MKHNKVLMIKPFLRWAGGKSKFVHEILKHMPPKEAIGTYYEPFLGAGSIFLAYQPNKAVLSDLNPDLIATFIAIRDNPSYVWQFLHELQSTDSENQYYTIRTLYNAGGGRYIQAARFIYLNQACFNGIFRVNQNGQYNVPYGFKKCLRIINNVDLRKISSILKSIKLMVTDYRTCLDTANENDMIYLDPPYPPLNGTSYFTHYTKERFTNNDQKEVADTAHSLAKKGCHVLITNADTIQIRNLYKGWIISEISRPRWVTSSCHKHRVNELIIVNKIG